MLVRLSSFTFKTVKENIAWMVRASVEAGEILQGQFKENIYF
jgi:hypothetical protein